MSGRTWLSLLSDKHPDCSCMLPELSRLAIWLRSGAVHTLAQCTHCVLDGNWFHDQHHGTKVTYIDGTSSGYTVQNHVVDNANQSLWLYYGESCRSTCPYYPGKEKPYAGCNATVHDKCCCAGGVDNTARACWVRNSLPDPFPIENISGLVLVPMGHEFPPEAQAIIQSAGPRA